MCRKSEQLLISNGQIGIFLGRSVEANGRWNRRKKLMKRKAMKNSGSETMVMMAKKGKRVVKKSSISLVVKSEVIVSDTGFPFRLPPLESNRLFALPIHHSTNKHQPDQQTPSTHTESLKMKKQMKTSWSNNKKKYSKKNKKRKTKIKKKNYHPN